MTNAFDAFAEAVMPSWARTRERASAKAAQTRAKTAAEKALAEDEVLERLWLAGERDRRRALLAGPYGREIKGLVAFLRTMTLSSADALVALVDGAAWLIEAPEDIRRGVFHLIAGGISELRVKEGLHPFDDPMPGEPDNAFTIIKTKLALR